MARKILLITSVFPPNAGGPAIFTSRFSSWLDSQNIEHQVITYTDSVSVIRDNLVEIGSHTVNHLDLTSITSDQAKYQIVESKNYFEKNFNIKITSFCYPYGFYNESLFSILEDAGYKTAVTTKQGIFYSNDNKFEIKRIRPGILTGNELISFLENLPGSK